MSAQGHASPRRAALDAVALAFAFLALDAVIIVAALAGWVDWMQGVVTVLALGAVVLLLYRDDVMDAIAAGNARIGRSAEESIRRGLDALPGDEWSVEHDVANASGWPVGTLAQGRSGAYLILIRHRAYRLEHLGRAKHSAAWLNGRLNRWVTPVVCLGMRDDTPHRRNGVWIMGSEHLLSWLESRPPENPRDDAA